VTTAPAPKESPPPRTSVVHCWVTAPIAELLSKEAARRGMHPDRLAAELLTIIVGDGLISAIVER